MGEYSIKDLEKLSGVKAHTIRIWEKRYRLIKPKRTSTNIRFYSDHELKKITNVALVNNSGVKISHIARLDEAELNRLVHEHSKAGEEIVKPIDKLLLATVEMKEKDFRKILSNLEKELGFEKLVIEVLYPFLEKMGILWHTGEITPAQEHFVSNIIRQKIIVAIDALAYPSDQSPKTILFLPENEFHEIGLLFYSYLARKLGRHTIYLGQSVPYNDVKQVVAVHQPKTIITSLITTLNEEKLDGFIRRLSHDFKNQTILISGMATGQFNFKPFRNIRHFKSVFELKELLRSE